MMFVVLTAAAATAPDDPTGEALGVVFGVLGLIVVIAVMCSMSGSSGTPTGTTHLKPLGGFKPIARGEPRVNKGRPVRVKARRETPDTRQEMRGSASRPQVDWITGEKLNR